MDHELKKILERLQSGEFFSFFDVMEAISSVTDLVTLDERPADPSIPPTVCELNGRISCND